MPNHKRSFLLEPTQGKGVNVTASSFVFNPLTRLHVRYLQPEAGNAHTPRHLVSPRRVLVLLTSELTDAINLHISLLCCKTASAPVFLRLRY